MTPATATLAACLLIASHTYQLPPGVLNGIMHVEGGQIGHENGPRFDGSYDLGPMQVNTQWVPALAHIWHVDNATARRWVRDDACTNIHVAAWILKHNIADTGSVYKGVADYHAGPRGYGGLRYASQVLVATQ